MSTQFAEPKPLQKTTLNDFILRAEALREEARLHGFSVVIGVDTPDRPYITSNTTLETSDALFLLITGLAPRQHPSVLTMTQIQDVMRRIEEDTEDLRSSNVPFVVGVQTSRQDKLKIISHLPEDTKSSLHAAHFDLTIDPDMLGETAEVPCS